MMEREMEGTDLMARITIGRKRDSFTMLTNKGLIANQEISSMRSSTKWNDPIPGDRILQSRKTNNYISME